MEAFLFPFREGKEFIYSDDAGAARTENNKGWP